MDRVVCDDVGFGKTEVAMRAAFVAVQGGRQVVALVPTTLLAQQHFENFTDRFADWPVRVESLSRFRTAKEQKVVIDGLERGVVDIVVGTHKLLSEGIKFKLLGLAIVNEEHRFGVRHKERLKELRAGVDLLTLTATPIPRTLNMALAGMRDLSIIATPPQARHPIKTFLLEIHCAGELLGEDQSGQIQEIGFALYSDLLEQAVQALKSGRTATLDRPLDHGAEIDLGLPALIPDDYHPDVHTRLVFYKRIAGAGSPVELDELQVEMIDRFGLLPEPAKALFGVTELKLLVQPLDVKNAGSRPARRTHPLHRTAQYRPDTSD